MILIWLDSGFALILVGFALIWLSFTRVLAGFGLEFALSLAFPLIFARSGLAEALVALQEVLGLAMKC